MPYSVLIIHDEPARQAALRAGLAKVGFEATSANEHMAALNAVSGERFDLLIAKADFPELDVRRLAIALRRPGGLNADTPVLAITKDPSQAFARDCWRSGVNALVLSPGAESDLLAAIRPLGFEHLAPTKPKPGPVPADDATSHAIFKALGDRRLELFMSIAEAGGLTASGVGAKAKISRLLSLYHIEQLVGVGLVERREWGKKVIFAVKTEPLAQVGQWLIDLAERLSA